MADNQNQNTILVAEHLDRIEYAKRLLALKATDMELGYKNDKGQVVMVDVIDEEGNSHDKIDKIAEAFSEVAVREEGEGIWVNGQDVKIPRGFYVKETTYTLEDVGRAETEISAEVKDNTIVITATNDQKTGYVNASSGAKTDVATIEMTINGKDVQVDSPDLPGVILTGSVADGSYSAELEYTKGDGYVDITDRKITMGVTSTSDEPTNQPYRFKITGAGQVSAKATASINQAGYIEKGSTYEEQTNITSNDKTVWGYVQATTVPTEIDPSEVNGVTVGEGYTSGQYIKIADAFVERLAAI